MTHSILTILISLMCSLAGFYLGPQAIKFRLLAYKESSLIKSAVGQLFALAFGFSLYVPVFYALRAEPKSLALILGIGIWVIVTSICMMKTYTKYKRVFKFLQKKKP
ncbi:hypothetical protein OAG1_11750 [Agarivorans sp. OAG1]|uniref:hypothetical protein n=1 Tax=Agarivorans sp. OAG1 TaxID=3082387 RepID=UPI002B2E406D|nr:hypothetical protein OAG1_11750 [Agarivorans sp. OAG1]